MSAKMLLATIKNLEVQNIDDDTLEGIAKSLDMIIESDTFDGLTQQEAFCTLTRIKETQGVRAAAAQAKCDANWQAAMKEEEAKFIKKEKIKNRAKKLMEEIKKQEDEVPPGSTEDDTLMRLKIRAEEDGTLSFEFRGIKWDWNHSINTWDLTPKKN